MESHQALRSPLGANSPSNGDDGMSARADIAPTSAAKPGGRLTSVVSGSSTAQLDTAITGKTNDSAVSPAIALQPPLGAHLVSRSARLFEAPVWRWLSLVTDAIV
ncbi:MAG TPA: hypothetical protein VMU90_06000, partial [Solirubrobacteraceae bacterium]|nr:hypothetical protein [Solirubrobacteraceae bacterium]